PRTHGVIHHGDKAEPRDQETFDGMGMRTLPQILKENGYQTMGVDGMGRWFTRGFDDYGYEKEKPLPAEVFHSIFKLPSIHIKHSISNLRLLRFYSKKRNFSLRSAWKGLSGGSKTFRFAFKQARVQDAGFVTDLGMDLAGKRKGAPFFLFLHYRDTHTPYHAPRAFRPRRENKASDLEDHLQDAYKGAVKYVDFHIGRLMSFLEHENLMNNTWLIITSNHGESLIEHDIFFDHHGLYDVTTHCPLIFHFPDRFKPGRRIKGFIQHIDLVPTLCDWLKIPPEHLGFDGSSLLPLMRGEKKRIRDFVFSEESYFQRKISLRESRFKYIFAPDNTGWCQCCGKVHKGIEELYDLEEDPGEAVNLVARHQKTAARMRRKLDGIIRRLNAKRRKEFIQGKTGPPG
ncbi:MAG: sulfatase, partial [Candidatus Aminicenantaceae bacterium]